MNSLFRTNFSILRNVATARLYCTSKVPKSVIEDLTSAQGQIENGVIYDKKPFKLHLEEKKNYSWCLCGKSKTQPLCDGFHKNVHYKIKQRPVRFQVEKTGKNIQVPDITIFFFFRSQEIITCAIASKPRIDLSAMEPTSPCHKHFIVRRNSVKIDL